MLSLTPPYKYSKLKHFFIFSVLTLSLNTTAIDADQVASQIKSKITNKAIDITEGYINTQANEFINNFGKGRTSIIIEGIESSKLNYSIDTIQPITEFNKDIKQLAYIQGSVFSGENEGNRRSTINLGLGQRYLIEDQRAIAGINLFFDYEGTSKHKRSSFGLEYQRSNFSLTANKYHPLSDKVVIGDYTEEPLAGHDINLTGQMPYAPWATIKGTHYYWDQIVGDNINGNILGVEIQLSPSTSFEFGQEESKTMEKSSYGKLSIKLPFDDNEKATNFALDDTPFRAAAIMDLTRLKSVKRSQQIKIEKLLNNIAPVFTSSATASVVENQTTAITLVATDEQVVTYSISGTDSALFGANASSGVVTFANAPDYESPSDADTNNTYVFTATATDAKGLATTQDIVVTVIDTDDTAPVFTSSATANAAENQTAAITLVATDATTVTYSISGTDASLFNINSGVVTFATAPDYETPGDSGADNVYNFIATATDTASNAITQSVLITVTDVSEIATVTSPDTGRIWMAYNLGATQVCTSSTDSDCYGDLYQWGRNDDGHESGSSTSGLNDSITPNDSTRSFGSSQPYDWTTADESGSLREAAWGDTGANDICPSGFSVPTISELKADTIDASTTDVVDATSAYSSFLKLPAAGVRMFTSPGNTADWGGYYWSSNTYVSGDIKMAKAVRFADDEMGGFSQAFQTYRAYSFSVRCIKD